jgi:hypothetical protein
MKNRFAGRNELQNKIRNWANPYRSRTFGVRRGKGRVGQGSTISKRHLQSPNENVVVDM